MACKPRRGPILEPHVLQTRRAPADPGLPLETTGASRCHRCCRAPSVQTLSGRQIRVENSVQSPTRRACCNRQSRPQDFPRGAGEPRQACGQGGGLGRRRGLCASVLLMCTFFMARRGLCGLAPWETPAPFSRAWRQSATSHLGGQDTPFHREAPTTQGPLPALRLHLLGASWASWLLSNLDVPPALQPSLPWAGEGCRVCQWRLPAAGGLEACGGRSPTLRPQQGTCPRGPWAIVGEKERKGSSVFFFFLSPQAVCWSGLSQLELIFK